MDIREDAPPAVGCGALDGLCDFGKKAGGVAKDFVTDPVGTVQDAAGGAAESMLGQLLDGIAEGISSAVASSVKSMVTLWVKTPTNIDDRRGTIYWVQEHIGWYIGAVAVLSVLVAAGRMAWSGRGQPAAELLRSLLTLVLVVGAGVTFVVYAIQAADGFSQWILDKSTEDTSFNERITVLLAGVLKAGPMGPMVVIMAGSLVMFATMIQSVMLIARTAVLILLSGILPLAGSATNTSWGKQWFEKTLAWMIGWILYKPAAALIYAAAFHMGGSEKGFTGLLIAISMIVMAIVALPALIRLCVPMVGGLASGGAGAVMGAGAGMAAMKAMGPGPTGAVSTPSAASGGGGGTSAVRSGGGGSSGGAGSSGPTGAAGTAGSSAPASRSPVGAAASSGGGRAAGAAGGGGAAGAGPAGVAAAGAVMTASAVKGAIASGATEQGGGGPSGHDGRS